MVFSFYSRLVDFITVIFIQLFSLFINNLAQKTIKAKQKKKKKIFIETTAAAACSPNPTKKNCFFFINSVLELLGYLK